MPLLGELAYEGGVAQHVGQLEDVEAILALDAGTGLWAVRRMLDGGAVRMKDWPAETGVALTRGSSFPCDAAREGAARFAAAGREEVKVAPHFSLFQSGKLYVGWAFSAEHMLATNWEECTISELARAAERSRE